MYKKSLTIQEEKVSHTFSGDKINAPSSLKFTQRIYIGYTEQDRIYVCCHHFQAAAGDHSYGFIRLNGWCRKEAATTSKSETPKAHLIIVGNHASSPDPAASGCRTSSCVDQYQWQPALRP